MKRLKQIGIYLGIYFLLSFGAFMAVQNSWWWMLPSVVSTSLGLQLVEFYARNYEHFTKE